MPFDADFGKSVWRVSLLREVRKHLCETKSVRFLLVIEPFSVQLAALDQNSTKFFRHRPAFAVMKKALQHRPAFAVVKIGRTGFRGIPV